MWKAKMNENRYSNLHWYILILLCHLSDIQEIEYLSSSGEIYSCNLCQHRYISFFNSSWKTMGKLSCFSLEIGIIAQVFELSCALTSRLSVLISPSMEMFYILYHTTLVHLLHLGYAIVSAIDHWTSLIVIVILIPLPAWFIWPACLRPWRGTRNAAMDP